MRYLYLLQLVCGSIGYLAGNAANLAEESRPPVDFLERNCLDCHQGATAEAGLDLSRLGSDFNDAEIHAQWTKIYDRVAAGEMPPPEDYGVLDEEEQAPFLRQAHNLLVSSQRTKHEQLGRVHGRRLTNLQLERTLQDLLGIDIPLEREMPEEPAREIFSSIADSQSISHFQLEQHLKVVDLALDEAFDRALTTDDRWKKEMSAKDISRTRTRTREPEHIDGAAVIWSSRLAFYGRLPATTAKQSGWYRFTFQVSSLKQPESHGVWCSVRSGQCVSSAPLMSWVGSFEATEEPKQVSFVAWLPERHMLEVRPGDGTLKMARFAGGQSANGEGGKQDVPGIKIDWLNMEKIHLGSEDSQVRDYMLGDLELTPHRDAARADLVVIEPVQSGKRLVERFATRAFRRPVADDEVAPYLDIFHETYRGGKDFLAALRAAYRAILCSPRFVYFYEQPGELDDYAIASRLSYMLWNSMPDRHLFQRAATGELRQPRALREEVARMLDSPRGEQFIPDFAAQWLELNQIGFTEPDSKLHPTFDAIVQYAMLDETHRFLQTMLEKNRSVGELIDAEYTFLNSRLARFYGIEGVAGDRLQRIEIPEDQPRGGLLAQGAILKVTANGTNTSPVLRGVWVSERILGHEIPPPPDSVPAIEPDIRGAKSIREQLEKHKNDSQCAACHRKIDAPGFALESFDAAGGWREHYPQVQGGRVKKGAAIDTSFVTYEGETFDDFREFRQLTAAKPERLARNLAEKLLTYGTGAQITFADREEVQKIVEQASRDEFGIRSILQGVVTSSTFLSK